MIWARFRRHRFAALATVVLLLVTLVVLAAPLSPSAETVR